MLRQGGPTFGSMTTAQHRNVPRRCGVGRPSMTATDALKAISRRSVAFVDAATFRAGARCVARIDADQRDAFACRFVGQEGPQLSKRPTMVRAALRPSNRCPFTDSRQVFDGNPAPGVFGL